MSFFRKALYLILGLSLLAACKPDPVEPTPNIAVSSQGVFILNEGNFQWGNASLDLYDPETEELQSGVFSAANEEALGDVLQSMTIGEGKAYLVVNNSGKVEVIDPDSLTRLGTLTGLVSPRFLLPISAEKAYVTDLYADAISIVDLQTNTVSGSIAMPGWTEQGVVSNGKAYICNVQRPYIYVVDTETDQVTDSIALDCEGATNIVQDAAGMLWVNCGASELDDNGGSLLRIDPQLGTVTHTLSFPEGVRPTRLRVNPAKDTLYYVAGDVYALPIEATSLPENPFLAETDWLVYGLGIDPRNGDLYVADAIDYVQRGLVFRYDAQGRLLDEIRVGLIPGGFGFR